MFGRQKKTNTKPKEALTGPTQHSVEPHSSTITLLLYRLQTNNGRLN